jgi:pimeloyl-ACP methyl ester carboxylesterase
MLLTTGDASHPIFAPVMAKLRAAVPGADVVTFAGAGHIPHVTHADVYIEVLTAFIRRGTA